MSSWHANSLRKLVSFSESVLMFCAVLALIALSATLPAPAYGAEDGGRAFYVDSRVGSDEAPGTLQAPWKSLDKVEAHSFLPGDTVYFARGSQFTGGFVVRDSGESGRPITFTAYGEGTAPAFSNPTYEHLNGNAIQVAGSHIVIDGLFFETCPKSPIIEDIRTLGAIFIGVGADHNIVRNCEMTRTPVGIQVYGQYCLVTKNYIHDNDVSIRPHWGPMCVVVCTSNNEISYNRFENYSAPSNEYGHDGGAIEINDRAHPKENIRIHHNYSSGNQGFVEFVGRVKQEGFVFHHNVSDDFQSFLGFTGPCTDMRVENNTVIRVRSHTRPDSEDVVFWSYFDNEDIVFRNNIFVYDPDKVEAVYARGKFPRDHNLYYRTDNPELENQASRAAYNRYVLGGGAWLGEGGVIANPLFVDFENRDFRLRADSPAIDAGASLGYTKDFDDNPIASGSAPDMGAYEYQH